MASMEKLAINSKPNAPVQIKSNWGVAVKESEIGLLLSFEPIRAPRFPEAHIIKWVEQLNCARGLFPKWNQRHKKSKRTAKNC
jgi:hypothetical protein